MQPTATLFLHPKKTRSVERFHPWVFSGAIVKTDGQPQPGDFVAVRIVNGTLLGHGFYGEGGSIAARMTHFGEEPPGDRWWHARLQNAYHLRTALGLTSSNETDTYRLVHGEGDGLPGLIIDHYAGVLVVQAHTAGMHRLLPRITESLVDIYGAACKAVYNKSGDTLPGGAEEGYLHGDPLAEHSSLEYGNRFAIDFTGGQKTGFFIDQRENRRLLGELSKDRKVLNTFSYTGGFSMYALNSGAQLVHSLDSSKRALDVGEKNLELNDFDASKHRSIQADAVQYLKHLEEPYDLIVLDPPAFAKHLKARHQAVQGYKRINALAMKHIEPGGLLFTFSCSQAVDRDLFTNTIIAAAIESGRRVRILHRLSQPADHPVNAFHPEGEYLKGLVVEVDG
ncbi:MAG: class I SAM-dependent rRNA methyltransferase [Flavobacteriales bacterium]